MWVTSTCSSASVTKADEGGGGADVAPVSVIGKMRHAADLIAGEDSAV